MVELTFIVCILYPMENAYTACTLCSRNCGIDRTTGDSGYCGETDHVRLASASIHFGEEPILTGKGGSGTLFFSGCAMKCPFCQNWQISHKGMGTAITEDTFAAICRTLAHKGAVNINLVTPSHFTPTIAVWISRLRETGFTLPFLWNSSGFDSMTALKALGKTIDIFLPDLKTLSPDFSKRYFKTSYYPSVVKKGLQYLADTKPVVYDSSGLLTQGTVVRHLVMPGELENSMEVLQWYADTLQGKTILSILTQYTPVKIPGHTTAVPSRSLSKKEYERILSFVNSVGIEDGFIQNWEPVQNREWLPDFSQKNSFGAQGSTTVWNWKSGFINCSLAF